MENGKKIPRLAVGVYYKKPTPILGGLVDEENGRPSGCDCAALFDPQLNNYSNRPDHNKEQWPPILYQSESHISESISVVTWPFCLPDPRVTLFVLFSSSAVH